MTDAQLAGQARRLNEPQTIVAQLALNNVQLRADVDDLILHLAQPHQQQHGQPGGQQCHGCGCDKRV